MAQNQSFLMFHRQNFGSVPRTIDDEDLVDPQVSSLNLLKAQQARKLEAANTAAASRHHVHKDHGKTLADSSLHSPTPKATGS